MQQSGSVSKLKRQLGFLKSINQKLEGLRRENERLRRLVSNPRVRFSRSSLGGLHRIVNSLKKASETHELNSVEEWADKTKSWLVNLGKRGDGPSNDELDWLAETISELSGIQDVAAAEVSEQIEAVGEEPEAEETKEADQYDPETLPPGAYEALEDMKEDAEDEPEEIPEKGGESESNGELPAPFPFKDEPKERSIAEAKFWKDGEKKVDRGFRDRTSTIPLAVDDLTSVSPPRADTNLAPPPVPIRTPGFWRPLAILSIVCALVMAGLLFKAKQDARTALSDAADRISEAKASCVSAPAPKQNTTLEAAKATETPKEGAGDIDSESKNTAAATTKAASDKTEDGKREAETKVAAVKPTEKKKPEKKQSEKTVHREKKKSKPPEKQPEKAPAKDVGTLVVKSPADGPVLVMVDGISRGKSPAKVKLSPGLHEVTFMKDGKKKIRMVPIRPDATKTITAVIPE